MQENLERSSVGGGTASEPPLLDRLRALVLSGEFPPGAPLPELFLAQEFQVSRTPVREALKQLENEGLVEIRPRVGTFVRQPTRREIVELFELKSGLEGLAAGLFARRGNVPELDALRRNLSASAEAVRRGDGALYAVLVHEFHNCLIAGADNRKLTEHYERLMNQLAYHRLVRKSVDQPGRLRDSLHEHESIVLAIESRDHVGAELATRQHVDASSASTMRALASEAGSAPADEPTGAGE
ncbi:GntR family transcriptional regulator [Agrococcus sp. HG114]|uniref:GntR family transcriptional regulator n=1 Tax=Agrococcus sp. HG114 TaxID=2969757 RepID=UPI00215A136D|nr:GntR family transcriptional regulator [Agrococcus sp. HG114]MCR8669545.1 GntR family transcriptional regulator [Agrococcus sp. HG114]